MRHLLILLGIIKPAKNSKEFIGFLPPANFRSRYGSCGGCGADEKTWCFDGCTWLDRMDYR